MDHYDELDQQLWEFVYGLLSEQDAAELRTNYVGPASSPGIRARQTALGAGRGRSANGGPRGAAGSPR